MRLNKTGIVLLLQGIFVLQHLMAQEVTAPALVNIMNNEMKREMNILENLEYPAYFMEYSLNESSNLYIFSSFGSVLNSKIDSLRAISASVRVGSYDLDNTHSTISGEQNVLSVVTTDLPFSNDEQMLEMEMWKNTNSAYSQSVEQYKKVLEEKEMENFKHILPDFSKAEPVTYFENQIPNPFNDQMLDEWKIKANELSALFLSDTSIVAGNVLFAAENSRKILVTSEGQQIIQNKQSSTLVVMAILRTSDNQLAFDMLTFTALTASELATMDEMKAKVMEMIRLMKQMQNAPIAEPFSGPALLSAQAAGVFFHEIFGHRVEGHRLNDITDSQTFGDKLNKNVLSKDISIYFDPTLTEYNGQHLTGSYRYDDEGVPSQRVDVVEKGILKNFLMSRKPATGFASSNGHGRSASGSSAVSRQSNMFIESARTYSDTELRKKLIAECKRQKKQYGYYFRQVTGGLTLNSVYSTNVFTVFPTEIFRIYTDGRPDELVRQVSLIGTPLTMFSEIGAAGDQPELFPGFCGAESGSIPVSIICPSFMVKKVETQRTPEMHIDRPLLTLPVSEAIRRN